MSKLLVVFLIFVVWYNIIAFVALDINFINWSWFERAALILLVMSSIVSYENHIKP